MIHQFLYARKRDGYRQLNDWSGTQFKNEDRAAMESLLKYTLTGGIDNANLPDCIYFHNADLSIGRAVVIGKTTYVRAGSSKESGDRETSFVHKYILYGQDYEQILNDPRQLFDINTFCETVENADDFIKETLELKDIQTVREAVGPDEMCMLVSLLGLDENDFVNFLYALIDSSHKLSRRVYLMLPSNDRNGSELARRFCEGLFCKLPRFIISNCGFITYTDTFHNTTTNNIPGAISLIFVADNEANAIKLKSMADDSYVFNKKRGYAPRFEIDMYTKEMLLTMKDDMLHGTVNSQYAAFYAMFDKKINPCSSFSPEMLGAAYRFYYHYRPLKEKNICVGEPEHLSYIFHTFLQDTDLVSKEIHQDVIDYTERVMAVKSGELQMDYIAGLYDTYEPIKEILIRKICDQCREAFNSAKNDEALLKILKHPAFNSGELLSRFYDKLYSDPQYYDSASLLVAINLSNWLQSDASSNDKKIKSIFESIADLYKHYPGLVLHDTYINYIFDAFKTIIFRQNPIEYDDVLTLYNSARDFVSGHSGCINYLKEVIGMAQDIIAGIDLGKIRKNDMDKLLKWKNNLLKYIDTPNTQILIKRFESQEIFEYRDILDIKNMDVMVATLSEKTPEQLAKIYPRICDDVLRRISYYSTYTAEYDKHFKDKFNLIMFKAAYPSKSCVELCSQILKCEGILSVKRLYDNIISEIDGDQSPGMKVAEVRKVMADAFQTEFGSRLNDTRYKEYKEVEEFVRDTLGLYYINLNAEPGNNMEKKKGLKNLFGR